LEVTLKQYRLACWKEAKERGFILESDRPSLLKSALIDRYVIETVLNRKDLEKKDRVHLVRLMYDLHMDTRCLNNLRTIMNSLKDSSKQEQEKGELDHGHFKKLFFSVLKTNPFKEELYQRILPEILNEDGDRVSLVKIT